MSLVIDNVDLGYYENNVFIKKISNINLNTKKIGLYILTGESGSGKTTFFKCINGELQPNSGNIKFNGTDIYNVKSKSINSSILYLSSKITYFDSYTIFQNLFFLLNGFVHKEKITKMLTKFNIISLKNTKLKNVSGGEKQLFILCLISLHPAKAFLCDEILNAIDYKYIDICTKFLTELSCSKLIIISSHITSIFNDRPYNTINISNGNISILEKNCENNIVLTENIYTKENNNNHSRLQQLIYPCYYAYSHIQSNLKHVLLNIVITTIMLIFSFGALFLSNYIHSTEDLFFDNDFYESPYRLIIMKKNNEKFTMDDINQIKKTNCSATKYEKCIKSISPYSYLFSIEYSYSVNDSLSINNTRILPLDLTNSSKTYDNNIIVSSASNITVNSKLKLYWDDENFIEYTVVKVDKTINIPVILLNETQIENIHIQKNNEMHLNGIGVFMINSYGNKNIYNSSYIVKEDNDLLDDEISIPNILVEQLSDSDSTLPPFEIFLGLDKSFKNILINEYTINDTSNTIYVSSSKFDSYIDISYSELAIFTSDFTNTKIANDILTKKNDYITFIPYLSEINQSEENHNVEKLISELVIVIVIALSFTSIIIAQKFNLRNDVKAISHFKKFDIPKKRTIALFLNIRIYISVIITLILLLLFKILLHVTGIPLYYIEYFCCTIDYIIMTIFLIIYSIFLPLIYAVRTGYKTEEIHHD